MPGDPDVLMSGWVDLSWSDSSSGSGRDPLAKLEESPFYTGSPHKWMFAAVGTPKSPPQKKVIKAANTEGQQAAPKAEGTSLDKALSTSPTASRSRHMWMFGSLITDPNADNRDGG